MVLKRAGKKKILLSSFLFAILTSIFILVTTVPLLLEPKTNGEVPVSDAVIGVFIAGIIFLVLLGIGIYQALKAEGERAYPVDNNFLIKILFGMGVLLILVVLFLPLLLLYVVGYLFAVPTSPETIQQDLELIRKILNSIFFLNQVLIFAMNVCFSSIPFLLGRILLKSRVNKLLWSGLLSNIGANLAGAGIVIYMIKTVEGGNIYGALIWQYFPLGLVFIGYTFFSIIYYKELRKD